ncbi:hypothetical protein [Amycolatopsis sp. lyj-109]|uniref:hypothetical protein n=1 Tax=Amycolatopsis sp. lyj-109 TaxID=2789287 RepID=UPI00397DE923
MPERLAETADAEQRTLMHQIAVSTAESVVAEARGVDLLAAEAAGCPLPRMPRGRPLTLGTVTTVSRRPPAWPRRRPTSRASRTRRSRKCAVSPKPTATG